MARIIAGTAIQAFHGCSLHLAADLTAFDASAGVNLDWDAEHFDDADNPFHDLVTNPERITIPAAFDGMYAFVSAGLRTSSVVTTNQMIMEILQRTSADAAIRFSDVRWEVGSAARNMTVLLGPTILSTGDFFRVFIETETDTSITVEGGAGDATFFGLWIIGR